MGDTTAEIPTDDGRAYRGGSFRSCPASDEAAPSHAALLLLEAVPGRDSDFLEGSLLRI